MRVRVIVLCCLVAVGGCKKDKSIPTVDFDDLSTDSGSDNGWDSSSGEDEIDSDDTDDTMSTDRDSDSGTDTDTPMDSESDPVFSEYGPLVSILSPVSPNPSTLHSDEIITGNQVEVLCEVISNPDTGEIVDSQSVQISVAWGDTVRAAAASLNTQSDVYSAILYVGDFNSGELTFTCTAADLAASPAYNAAQVITYLDKGPEIVIYSPVDNSHHGSSVELQFQVFRNPMTEEDPGVAIAWNQLEVWLSGTEIRSMVSASASQPNLFSGTIYFDDAAFSPSIDGVNTIQIRVPDARTPEPVYGEAEVHFVADSAGPTIAPVTPEAGELLGGQIQIEAIVADTSGVDPLSVVATVAGQYEVQLTQTSGNVYGGLFDSRLLAHEMVYPNIILRARDTLGNQNAYGYIVALDNRPPLLSLDPPAVRESRINSLFGNTECSWMFDPLGGWDPDGVNPHYGDSMDDGESAAQLFEVRARIEDLGNELNWIPGIETPRAGVNPDSVKLYILNNENGALIVDTNDDGFCDSINPLVRPTSLPSADDEAIIINLMGLQPKGSANFNDLPEVSDAQPAFDLSQDSPENMCTSGSAGNVPLPICAGSPATRIIPSTTGSSAIYSIPPADGAQCMGTPIDSIALNLTDGWLCLAVEAEDTLGNVGISAPIRICVDHDGDGSECADWGVIESDNLPDCTGTFDPENEISDAAADCVLREQDLVSVPEYPRSLLFEDYPQLQLISP